MSSRGINGEPEDSAAHLDVKLKQLFARFEHVEWEAPEFNAEAALAAVKAGRVKYAGSEDIYVAEGIYTNEYTATIPAANGMPSKTVGTCRTIGVFSGSGDIYPAMFDSFRGEMWDISKEAELLSTRLLRDDATFKHDVWGKGGRKQGTGVWDEKFGQLRVTYIEEINVHHDLRGQGIGTMLFNHILESYGRDELEVDFATLPGELNADVDRKFGRARNAESDAYCLELELKARAFLRKLGFRRIGLSEYLGYSMDCEHPSRLLTVEDDRKMDHMGVWGLQLSSAPF